MESGRIPSSVKKAIIDNERIIKSIKIIKAIPILIQAKALKSKEYEFFRNCIRLFIAFFKFTDNSFILLKI